MKRWSDGSKESWRGISRMRELEGERVKPGNTNVNK